MWRFVSVMIMLGGLIVLSYGGWQIVAGYFAQDKSLAEAKQLIENSKSIDNEEQIQVEELATTETSQWNPEQVQYGDIIGILEIPRLDAQLPIISGTNEEELARGVGYFTETALPDQGDQILLSGHRDTVFRRMGELEMGDLLIIHMPYGSFTYSIHDSEIVPEDDTSVIRSTAPEEILTLSTCYPFHFIGSAPDRYILYAYRNDELNLEKTN